MDEILASIKKVIAEEKEFLAPKDGDDVLELDETMVEDGAPSDGTGHEPAVPPASLMADDAAARVPSMNSTRLRPRIRLRQRAIRWKK